MTDGQQLKDFIDNQPISKIKIATALGMSKQNLFGLFKSKVLSEDTKVKFEKYFNKAIFTNKSSVSEDIPEYRKPAPSQNQYTDNEVIELLKSQIKTLESHCSFVQKMYEDMKDVTNVNLREALNNQRVMMRQIAVQAHVTAERFAGNDKRKFQEELDKIDRLMTAGM